MTINQDETKRFVDVKSPYSGEVIQQVPLTSSEGVDKAISQAVESRDALSKMSAFERANILENLVHLFEQRKEEAAKVVALETAKPITTAMVEVERTIQTYKISAEEAKRIYGETLPLDAVPGGEGKVAYTVREPLGVIGAITPFNFPMNLVAHKVGPAIASGNTIVLKPATKTPLSALFLEKLIIEAGLPEGCFNIVIGSGRTVGNQIVTDDRIKMITFTGSPKVGTDIRNKAGLKRVTLELGSNSAVIIDKNVDLEKVIPRCINGAYTFQGQMCIALQRIYVHEDMYDNFVKKFVEEAKSIKIGNPLHDDVQMSALISENDVGRTLNWIDEARENGANVILGGEREGNILLPTVILDATSDLKVSCQEVFAPIVVINKFSEINEAFERVNDSKYGLQAGVYTNDVHVAFHAAEKLYVGGVIINDIPTFRVDHMPYGGVKQSGVGREGIKYAIEEMTELKLVVFNRL